MNNISHIWTQHLGEVSILLLNTDTSLKSVRSNKYNNKKYITWNKETGSIVYFIYSFNRICIYIWWDSRLLHIT